MDEHDGSQKKVKTKVALKLQEPNKKISNHGFFESFHSTKKEQDASYTV